MTERNYAIDFFKGVTIINIIFIHTVWWTGQNYVPNIIAQFSLLIDVPLFFFLSGASATFSFKKENPFSGIVRLCLIFTLYSVIYTAFTEPHHINKHFIDSLFLQYPNTPKLFVVFGSMWFIPKFIVVYILGYIVVKNLPNKVVLPIFCLMLLYGIYNFENIEYFNNLSIFSVKSDYIFFYLFMFLFGFYYFDYMKNWDKIKQFSIFLFSISLILLINYFKDKSFNLQEIKFDPRFYYLVASMLSVSLVMYFTKSIKNNNFMSKIGQNALSYYLAQGISSTLIKEIVNNLNMQWEIKLLIVFISNLVGTYIIGQIFIYLLSKYLVSIKYIFNKLEKLK